MYETKGKTETLLCDLGGYRNYSGYLALDICSYNRCETSRISRKKGRWVDEWMGEWVDEYMGIEEEENREKEAGSFKRFFNLKA